jgi:hypothetical protein
MSTVAGSARYAATLWRLACGWQSVAAARRPGGGDGEDRHGWGQAAMRWWLVRGWVLVRAGGFAAAAVARGLVELHPLLTVELRCIRRLVA